MADKPNDQNYPVVEAILTVALFKYKDGSRSASVHYGGMKAVIGAAIVTAMLDDPDFASVIDASIATYENHD